MARIASPSMVGRNRRRALLVWGIVLALLPGSFLAGLLLDPRSWISEEVLLLALMLVGFPVASGAVAAANAAWNDGFVLSWLLVFAPVFGWLLSNVYNQLGPVYLEQTYFSLGLAVLTASIVGTVGYTVGILYRRRDRSAPGDRPVVLRLFVGDESTRPAVWALRGGGLFLVATAVTFLTSRQPFPTVNTEVIPIVGPRLLSGAVGYGVLLVGGSLVLAMWPASRNAGILFSWGVLFGPLFGMYATAFVLSGLSGSGLVVDVLYAFLLALVLAVILGSGGFVIGRCSSLVLRGRA